MPFANERERAGEVERILREAYPEAGCTLTEESPFRLLVAARLSAQCRDDRVNEATPALFARFPDPAAMSEATPGEIEPYIRALGLYRVKARDLVAMARALVERHGGAVPGTMEELTALPGVGRKTANLILGDVFGVPGAVVADTHLIRICGRLGFTDTRDPYRVETRMRELLDPAGSAAFCHRAVAHGRAVCLARRPACPSCPLRNLCPSRDPGSSRGLDSSRNPGSSGDG